MKLPRLPRWIPQTPKPLSWPDVWEAMTPDERRWSFLVDIAICVAAVFLFWLFLG